MSKIYSVQDLSYEINNRKIIEEVTCNIERVLQLLKALTELGKLPFLNFFLV